MYDRVSPEFIPAAIGHIGGGGLRFLLWAPAEKISAGKRHAVRAHDGYGHVSILVVDDVSHSILTERVANPTLEASVLPGYESPCANERIGYHHKALSLVPSRQIQGTEIDVRFVGLGRRSQRAAAVPTKPPGIRLTTGAWGTRLNEPHHDGYDELGHLLLLPRETSSQPLLSNNHVMSEGGPELLLGAPARFLANERHLLVAIPAPLEDRAPAALREPGQVIHVPALLASERSLTALVHDR
jgi:hypothetical protein